MLSILARKSILVCLVVLLFLSSVNAVQQRPRHHHRGHKHKHHRHRHAHKHHHVKSCRNSTVSSLINPNATSHTATKPMPLAAHNHGPVNLTNSHPLAAHNHGPVNLTSPATECNKTKSTDHSSAGKKGIPKTLIPKHKHSKSKPKTSKTNSTSSGSSSSSSGAMSVSAGFSGAKALWAPPAKSLSFADFDVTQEAYRMDVTKIVQAPNGISAIKAIYPQGSIDPGNKGSQGGFGFYASPKQIQWKSANTVSLSYGVYFQPGFGWQMGGKLPGLIGGHTGCSGGVDAKAAGCFSTRFMWRENGLGEVYLYIPANDQDPSFWKVGPKTINTGMGISFARGSFSFKAGAWTQIQQVVTLNDPGQKNGKLVVSVNGKQVLSFDKMNYRDADIPLIGIDGESFFGGSSQEYASPKTQYAYFGNWHVAAN